MASATPETVKFSTFQKNLSRYFNEIKKKGRLTVTFQDRSHGGKKYTIELTKPEQGYVSDHEIFNKKITEMELQNRTRTFLENNKIETIKELIDANLEELFKNSKTGEGTQRKIKNDIAEALKSLSLQEGIELRLGMKILPAEITSTGGAQSEPYSVKYLKSGQRESGKRFVESVFANGGRMAIAGEAGEIVANAQIVDDPTPSR